jgi:hypothetical protein
VGASHPEIVADPTDANGSPFRTIRVVPQRTVALLALLILAITLTGVREVLVRDGETSVVAAPIEAEDEAQPVVTSIPTTTTSTAPAPTTTTTTVPPAPPTTVTAAATPPLHDLSPYNGLGTWIDVYDWSVAYGKDGALVDPGTVDQMARVGVQTLYVQTSKWDAPTDVLEPERLLPIIDRAHANGMRVVAWYLPTFEDPQRDMARLMAASRLHVEALAVDIESLKLKDVPERNRRLIEISTNLRAALPTMTLAAIPFPPVAMDVINPNLWPSFPWTALGPLYDIWMPMSYQTERKPESGYRDGYRYMAENIDRLRGHLGSAVPIHAIGGVADRTTPDDVEGIYRASLERQVIGGSLYDWRTTSPELWARMQRFRV